MDLHTYEILYRTEETHWWHAARRHIVLDWIEQRYPGRTDLSILDAGCGTGLMLQQMSHLGHAEGVDIAEQALDSDAALLVDPNDDAGFAAAVEPVLTRPDLREPLIQAGKARARNFTWDRCAQLTADVYKRAARSKTE